MISRARLKEAAQTRGDVEGAPDVEVRQTFPSADLVGDLTVFNYQVPASLRSQYVSAAIPDKLGEREAQLVRASETANNSTDVREIESTFDALGNEADWVQERW